MPELPEVETIVSQLRGRGIEGKRIRSVKINWEKTVEPLSGTAFCRAVLGTEIERLSRTGKWIQFDLSSGQFIMVHLRMSGSFSMEPGSHDRLVVNLSDGLSLFYRDTRKFGRWRLVDDPQEVLHGLGPDALTRGFSRLYFQGRLEKTQRGIKAVILDQAVVAGLGNIYADEALWRSGIHPGRAAASLGQDEVERLYKAIKHVLRQGIKNRGTSLGDGKTNYRQVDGESGENRGEVMAYGKGGTPCRRCGTTLQKCVMAQRGTTFCPRCQKI